VARERPIASQVPPASDHDDTRRRTHGALSRSEMHALSRCAPLTKSEFKSQRELADKNVFPPTARLTVPIADPPTRDFG
jgi:hypothetical protein